MKNGKRKYLTIIKTKTINDFIEIFFFDDIFMFLQKGSLKMTQNPI